MPTTLASQLALQGVRHIGGQVVQPLDRGHARSSLGEDDLRVLFVGVPPTRQQEVTHAHLGILHHFLFGVATLHITH